MTPLLSTRQLDAGYNGHPVVRSLELVLRAGEVCALLGANGAGKTTTMLTLAGELPPIAGEVRLFGSRTKTPLHRRARKGLAFVPEERSVLKSMTVAENLRVAGADSAYALELFPELEPLLGRSGGLISGGEQQILTLARALARRPRVLLVDELSLGLAPMVVTRLLDAIRRAADNEGVGVLMVEQHTRDALRVADTVTVMRRGEVVLRGSGAEFTGREAEIEAAYLSVEEPASQSVAAPGPRPGATRQSGP